MPGQADFDNGVQSITRYNPHGLRDQGVRNRLHHSGAGPPQSGRYQLHARPVPSSRTSALEKDRLHLGAQMVLSFYAHLPAVRADGDGLKAAEKLPYLAFREVVGENAAAPPKCPCLHLFALSGPHIFCSEIPEKEPPSGQRARAQPRAARALPVWASRCPAT